MFGELKIFSGNSNLPLAQEICKQAGVKLGECEIKKFSNDNIKVKYAESIRNKDVYIIQSSCTPVSDSIVELLIMTDAARHASAARVTVVCPYFPYARTDKKDEPRVSITARLMADLIQTAGADRVITMNLHSPQIQGFFRIPCDHLLAGKILCDFFSKQDLENCVVIAPDAGSSKLAGNYAIKLNLPLAILDKRRHDDSEHPTIHNVIGDVKNKKAIIFDDEIATGGSIFEVVKSLQQFDVKEITACCVHAVLSGNCISKLENSAVKRLVVTDTIFIPTEKRIPKITVVSVADLFASAITCTNSNRSISDLYFRF